jgi:regulator of protease activity HflC (stomatin/prohibitin superfamily)
MITTIPQNHCRIIERFGKPVKVQHSGLAFKLPIIDKVLDVTSIWGSNTNQRGVFIELTEQIDDTDARECFTKDNAKVKVDAIVSWRVVDPIKAVYEVDHLHKSLIQATLNVVRSEIGSMVLDEVLSARTKLNESIVSKLSETSKKWGVSIIRAEIQEIKTDDATSAAMLQQVDSERKSRAITAEAEGQAKAITQKAAAEKAAAIMRAEGQAKALELIAAAEQTYLQTLSGEVGYQEAAKILLTQKVIEGYDVITSNPSSQVFIPSGTQSFIDLASVKSSELIEK